MPTASRPPRSGRAVARVAAVAAASRQARASQRTVPPRTATRRRGADDDDHRRRCGRRAGSSGRGRGRRERRRDREAEGTEADPGRRRTTRIHVPGDPDAPAVAPEVIQEAVAEHRSRRSRRSSTDDEPEADADDDSSAGRRRERRRHGRRRRTGRRQAQDAPRQPWRQEPAQEAGRSRSRARRGRGRDRGRRRRRGCRRRDRERRGADEPTGPDEGAVDIALEPEPELRAGRDGAGRRADARGGRAVSGRVRRSGLRADVRVARRFRPQVMAAFRYTPSACGRLPAFSAPESTLA